MRNGLSISASGHFFSFTVNKNKHVNIVYNNFKGIFETTHATTLFRLSPKECYSKNNKLLRFLTFFFKGDPKQNLQLQDVFTYALY